MKSLRLRIDDGLRDAGIDPSAIGAQMITKAMTKRQFVRSTNRRQWENVVLKPSPYTEASS